jgi:hypothetical protein
LLLSAGLVVCASLAFGAFGVFVDGVCASVVCGSVVVGCGTGAVVAWIGLLSASAVVSLLL